MRVEILDRAEQIRKYLADAVDEAQLYSCVAGLPLDLSGN